MRLGSALLECFGHMSMQQPYTSLAKLAKPTVVCTDALNGVLGLERHAVLHVSVCDQVGTSTSNNA